LGKSIFKVNSDKNSNLISFGHNPVGQLGNGLSNKEFNAPQYIEYSFGEVADIVAGEGHSLALTKEGKVWTWGSNSNGQLGIGSDVLYKLTPTELEYLPKIKKISASNKHSIALDENGHVWTWGNNFSGQLGNGSHVNSNKPVMLDDLSGVSSVVAGYRFSLVIKNDGKVWAFGASCGQNQNPEFKDFLKKLSSGLVSLDDTYFSASTKDLEVKDEEQWDDCLGEDFVNIKSTVPVEVVGLDNVSELSAGYGHILALKKNGDLFAWGCNKYGQVGVGIFGNSEKNSRPQFIMSDVAQISAGFRHSLVLKKNGSLWAWGHNISVELGVNGGVSYETPVEVPVMKDATFVRAGKDYSLALKKDGSVWIWGQHIYRDRENLFMHLQDDPVKLQQLSSVTKFSPGAVHLLVLLNK